MRLEPCYIGSLDAGIFFPAGTGIFVIQTII